MHEEYGLQFRSFVPSLMELLEDADGMVRDCARNTVIELFKYVFRLTHQTTPLTKPEMHLMQQNPTSRNS